MTIHEPQTWEAPPRAADVPSAPVIALLATPGGQAMVDGDPVAVPVGVDPRAAAANVVVERAHRENRPFRAILTDADGQRWRMLITARGVYAATTPIPATPPQPAPGQDERQPPAPDTRRREPEEPEAFEPADYVGPVPAYPRLAITLTDSGKAHVDGQPVAVPAGADLRGAAIAAAAATARAIGRPVRAVAREADGTVWPLIIHPDGTTREDPDSAPDAEQRRGGLLAALGRRSSR